jgi:hypothetical protein
MNNGALLHELHAVFLECLRATSLLRVFLYVAYPTV